jgi:hypothetical protein
MMQESAKLSADGRSNANTTDLLLKWLLIPAAIAIFAFMLQRSVALIGLDLHHDTLMFGAARQLLNGEIPFRDFFYQYNLGTVFFHAFALNNLGEHIVSLKIVTAIAYAFIAVLIYSSAVSVQHRLWAVASALLWTILSPFYMPAMNGYHAWSTVYMMAAVMGGGLCLSLAINGRATVWALLGGVCFNLAFWFKQVAALQILAVLAWVAYNALRNSLPIETANRLRRILLGLALGGGASSVPFFYYIFRNEIFEDWWQSAFVFNGYFAASGNSATGVFELARTFFPVNQDLGYFSVVWAILPFCLIAIITQRQFGGTARLFSRPDDHGLVTSLFAVLSVAGWLEYFPLAHSFHTQLFMAPMFVLLPIYYDQIEWKSQIANKKQRLVIALHVLVLIIFVYQAHWHIRGLREKLKSSYILITDENPAKGIKLSPENYHSFENFYNSMIRGIESAGDSILIPLSVDPLRALLPANKFNPADFKMGLNWTFPNEIIEPGFNKRLIDRLSLRESSLYADSLIMIPGYIPYAVLHMNSPITNYHTFYIPSKDKLVIEPEIQVIDTIPFMSPRGFSNLDRSQLEFMGESSELALIKINSTDELLNIDKIESIHVSVLRKEDVPKKLTIFQYENYLKRVPSELASRMRNLYTKKTDLEYVLKERYTQNEFFDIAKFLLSTGKLFEQQNLPIFYSTLSNNKSERPIIVRSTNGVERKIETLWSVNSIFKNRKIVNLDPSIRIDNFLAFPGGGLSNSKEVIFLIQIIMFDKTTKNFYIQYYDRQNLK